METLPYLVLEKIVQQLTPQDLARCSAVCRGWRKVFNHDWMWEPHCDPELEEPLRTIPSVASPVFVSPEDDDSTLPSICRWRLAYMREKHLWKNWGKQDIRDVYRIGKDLIDLHFLTDTLVVIWYSDHIEILDFSVKPPVSWAKFYPAFGISSFDQCSVVGTALLIVEKDFTVEVYNANMTKKSIEFKHRISVQDSEKYIAEKHSCMLVFEETSSQINIYDLGSSEIIKKQVFPLKNENESVEFLGATTYSTSDFIAVCFEVTENTKHMKLYVYDIKQLVFLPGVVFDISGLQSWVENGVALHQQWLAYSTGTTLAVYDLKLKEGLHEESNTVYEIFVCENSFVFSVANSELEGFLKSYSPLHKTSITLSESHSFFIFKSMCNKLFTLPDLPRTVINLWTFSGKKVKCEKLKFDHKYLLEINQSCTKIFEKDYWGYTCVRYCW